MRRLILLLVILLPLSVARAPVLAQTSAGNCGLSAPAFCDTFDQPFTPTGRSGQLNGVIWGASRVSNTANPYNGYGDGWYPSEQVQCGAMVLVHADNDINVCNGQMVESVNDGGYIDSAGVGHGSNADTILALYPKQPFDFAGRTGKVVFDVNADSQGNHAAWPDIVITDLPVPAPSAESGCALAAVPGTCTEAANSFGLSIAGRCTTTSGAGGTNIDGMWTTTNYAEANVAFASDGCVAAPDPNVGPSPLNHFELDISPTGIVVYGTDAGTNGPLVQIAHADVAMPLTRGLIWLEDIHYNACKFNLQCEHTFVWDNVGFDGPVLARDLSFDVLDRDPGNGIATATYGPPATLDDLGWRMAPDTTQTLTTIPVSGIADAAAAVLTLNSYATSFDTITYSLNGHTAHAVPWPFPDQYAGEWRTEAIPLDKTELQAGVNTISLSTSDQATIANVDIKLVGAGGVPSCINPSGCAAPIPSPSPSPTPSPTPVPTPSPSPAPANITCPTGFKVTITGPQSLQAMCS